MIDMFKFVSLWEDFIDLFKVISFIIFGIIFIIAFWAICVLTAVKLVVYIIH